MNGIFKGLVVGWALSMSVSMAVNNPLQVPLDGAMVRHNGLYYGLQGGTNGVMLVSTNLVDWSSPVSVLSDDEPGPYELIYRNGLFHLYAGDRGYSVSDHPTNSFPSLRKVGISGGQIRLSHDDEGVLFSVNRRMGSKKEGEIWLQRYSAPWDTSGKPKRLLDGRKGMWDSIDSADLGEPEIFKHRDTYYLLYAANNASPRTGLREIGVAMNENPARLDNPDIVADPVLVRNAERLARTYKTILPTAEYAGWNARYSLVEPEEGWTRSEYTYNKWRTGEGAFGFPSEVEGAQLFSCRTPWKNNEIWVRREFDLPRGIPKTPVLKIRHEGAVKVYVNGQAVYESIEPSIAYRNIDISQQAEGAFTNGNNVVAVQSKMEKDAEYRFLDFGLYDADSLPVEPAIYGLDSPRLIEGPNGFEKWLTYRAWWDGQPGTGLDRVYFYGKEMVVDGPTTTNTPGYHPPPAKPTFFDTFPESETLEWSERWHFGDGKWAVADGVLQQDSKKGECWAYLNRDPAENYLFETGIRFPTSGKGSAGIIAWSDGKRDLVVSVNPASRSWEYHIEPGRISAKRMQLPNSFKFIEPPPGLKQVANPLQWLRVTKNGNQFNISLNGIDLLNGKPLVTKLAWAGVPGIYSRNSAAEFDGVTYTIGWDEHGDHIAGWGAARDGTASGGDWRQDEETGLEQHRHSEIGRAFKGDLLDQYEFCVNAQLEKFEEGKERTYGVFPVFADQDNYLKAMIDSRARELVVTGKLGGREIKPVYKSLKTQVVHRYLQDNNTSYKYLVSWIYKLRSQSIISAIDVRWLIGEYEHLQQEFFVPTDDMDLRYAKLGWDRKIEPEGFLWDESRFSEADEPRPRQQQAGILNRIDIREEVGNYIGFGFYTLGGTYIADQKTGRYIRNHIPGDVLAPGEIIADGGINESDVTSRPQETVIHVEAESSYFFRCVKLKDRVIIELNGRPMAEVEGSWPPSQVGLLTEGQPCFFNGMSLHHLPE